MSQPTKKLKLKLLFAKHILSAYCSKSLWCVWSSTAAYHRLF